MPVTHAILTYAYFLDKCKVRFTCKLTKMCYDTRSTLLQNICKKSTRQDIREVQSITHFQNTARTRCRGINPFGIVSISELSRYGGRMQRWYPTYPVLFEGEVWAWPNLAVHHHLPAMSVQITHPGKMRASELPLRMDTWQKRFLKGSLT